MYYWAHSEKILQRLEILPVSKPAWPEQDTSESQNGTPLKETAPGTVLHFCLVVYHFMFYNRIIICRNG